MDPATPSLPEVHSSVNTAHPTLLRRMFAFAGPAYLVSVGYMDPGNWATDLEGGARFGYELLWVLVASNAMAILLQTLSARLGIVSGRDLAQACREVYPRPVSHILWLLCEVAIAACDLAEVLGAAIGLNLLFGLPLVYGVLLTAADTLLLLAFSRFGIRSIETIIVGFITVIAGCFVIEIVLAKPDFRDVARGLIPKLTSESLYVAIGILGATVMPHNLYLHSSLVQTRQIGGGDPAKASACRFNLIDSFIALNGALFVNASILVLAGATFFTRGIEVTEIQQAHQMLAPLLGTTLASVAFAVALLLSGQSSTITGTMAGQIVMEGFLDFRMRPWLRRLITRSVAVIPAVITIYLTGDNGAFRLLILSQVILSLQLPFAVIPLIHFTSDRARMGRFVNAPWVKVMAWSAAALIVALNLKLAGQTIAGWSADRPALLVVVVPLTAALLLLLGWVTFEPWVRHLPRSRPVIQTPDTKLPGFESPVYRRILVTLDHSRLDRIALAHAASLARAHGASLLLLHIEEGVTSQIYGELAETAEVQAGRAYFKALADSVRSIGIPAELTVLHAASAGTAIPAFARSHMADLLVMGAHGHTGIQDLMFGTTINEVRHSVDIPVLIVRG
jgi:manganese transport protein